MSKRRAKRRGGTLSVSIIVIAFLVVMVVQVVQLKQKESTYAAQKAELEKQYTKESEANKNIVCFDYNIYLNEERWKFYEN